MSTDQEPDLRPSGQALRPRFERLARPLREPTAMAAPEV